MDRLSIRLLGKLQVRRAQNITCNLSARKTQELFAYLLLHRAHPHFREGLASLLWDNTHCMKYLRQTLWQLQTALDPHHNPSHHDLLQVDDEWIGINPEAEFWLDVAELERAFLRVQGMRGDTLADADAQALRHAASLYQGDLLEGWYQDWCLYERERLRGMYLGILDKLMDYSEAHEEYEAGVEYGAVVLRYDRARERTHQRMMRLYYLAGHRTAALRQYKQCVAALQEELDVPPSKRTRALHEQIRQDRWCLLSPTTSSAATDSYQSLSLSETLSRLRELQAALSATQFELQETLHALEAAMRHE